MWNFIAGVPMEIKLSDMYGAGYMYGGDDYYYYGDREEEMLFYGSISDQSLSRCVYVSREPVRYSASAGLSRKCNGQERIRSEVYFVGRAVVERLSWPMIQLRLNRLHFRITQAGKISPL